MKLTGSKLFSSVIFTLSSTTAIAAPDLVEFSAGTPAKAEEVNSNFSNLKTFTSEIDGRVTVIENASRSDAISSLQEKVTALEAVDHSAPVTALNNRVTPLENLDLTTALPALQNKVTALESADHLTPVTAIDTRVTSLENVDHSTPITTLQGRVTPLESSVLILEGKVTTLENNDVSADILDLQNRVTALESASPASNSYTIEVTGDGVVIGHTNKIAHNIDKPFIALKTIHGMAALRAVDGSTEYYLTGYDALTNKASHDETIVFSEASCTDNPTRTINNYAGSQLYFTQVANTTDDAFYVSNSVKSYIVDSGTVFTKTASDIDLYTYSAWDGSCNPMTMTAGTLMFPLTELSDGVHGLKGRYSVISIDGYSSN